MSIRMGNRAWSILTCLTAFVLVLGILPSFTALSEVSKMGPLNPIKIFAPLILAFVGFGLLRVQDKRERRGYFVLAGAWVIGSFFTLFAASRCGFPPLFLREWAAMSFGVLTGIALRLFSSEIRGRIFLGWFTLVFLAVFLDLFIPSTIDWLYSHVFDPETRKWDFFETGTRALTGVFGRQSAAKLMAWLPWLALPVVFGRSRRFLYLGLTGIGVWSGLILATSQRGPMLGSFAALFIFGAHRAWVEKKMKIFFITLGVLFLGVASIFLTVPEKIFAPRLLNRTPIESSGSSIKEDRQLLTTSAQNAQYRVGMTRLSLDSIQTNPFGNACIPKSFFTERGMNEGHSHSLILEQFRSRGWIWGLVHLGLWILAAWAFIRGSSIQASSSFAALVSIMVSGLVDHPWFVLNQSIVLGAVFVEGVLLFFSTRFNSKHEA